MEKRLELYPADVPGCCRLTIGERVWVASVDRLVVGLALIEGDGFWAKLQSLFERQGNEHLT